MNIYDVDYEKFQISKKITDEKEILKLKLVVAFLKATEKMESSEIIAQTGLHKADLSRLRCLSVGRFSLDRIVSILDSVGCLLNVTVKKRKVS